MVVTMILSQCQCCRRKEKEGKKKKHKENSNNVQDDAMDICQDGLSRLHIASTSTTVPLNVSFGRRKGPSLARTK